MGGLPQINIVGIGDDGVEGLSPPVRCLLDTARVLIGQERLLAIVANATAQRIPIGGDLNQLVAALEKLTDPDVVLLTGGDPLFYGVARFLCERLGKHRFNVVPHVSSMQLAFARVKESWDDAYLANLDTIDFDRALDRIRLCERAGLFTTEAVPPAEIARRMLAEGLDYFQAYVCEDLGTPRECVTRGELAEITGQSFSPLNVMILLRKPDVPDQTRRRGSGRLLGNPDEAFQEAAPKRGLLTPMEVRVVALALLGLTRESIVWDVGAGSGSVAIEAAKLAQDGHVYAIEMDAADHSLIVGNAQALGARNVTAVLGQAPEIWSGLPAPDAIFVGGTGRQVASLAAAAFDQLRPEGRLVVNVNSLDSVVDVTRKLQPMSPDVRVSMLEVAHGVEQFDSIRLETRNPAFLVFAKRTAGTADGSGMSLDQEGIGLS